LADRDYCIKPGYMARTRPDYFVDDIAGDVVWQPDVYPLATSIARKLGCTTIIDIGCGNARKLVALHREFHVVGIDYGENHRHCSQAYPFGTWISADLESCELPPFEDGVLEKSVLICADVIEHLVDPTALLRTMKSFLERSPAVLLSTPERDLTRGVNDYGPPANPSHVREWNIQELESLLQAFGMRMAFIGLTLSNNAEREFKTILAVAGNNRWAEARIAELGDACHSGPVELRSPEKKANRGLRGNVRQFLRFLWKS